MNYLNLSTELDEFEPLTHFSTNEYENDYGSGTGYGYGYGYYGDGNGDGDEFGNSFGEGDGSGYGEVTQISTFPPRCISFNAPPRGSKISLQTTPKELWWIRANKQAFFENPDD
jgi:hypothetical protein